MSKQRIRWIVALMAVGLLGLVGLQLYWVRSAYRLQQEQFTYKVTDALQEVVRTLERQEISYLARQRIRAQEQQQKLIAISKKDSQPAAPKAEPRQSKVPRVPREPVPNRINGQLVLDDNGNIVRGMSRLGITPSDALHPVDQTLTPEQEAVVEHFLRRQEMLMATGDWQAQLEDQRQFEEWASGILADQIALLNRQQLKQDSLAKLARRRQAKAKTAEVTSASVLTASTLKDTGNRMSEHSQIVKDALKSLFLSDRPIEERVDRMTLDTLLRQALEDRGIRLPFAYGVKTNQTSKPSFLFTTFGGNPKSFVESGYKAALFPNNFLDSGNYVYVYFPGQDEFIQEQMTFNFASSVILILVILGCFYIAINTIMKQKKLADIKNDFINNMTHEFKTPISTIALAVEMAQDQMAVGQSVGARGSGGMYGDVPVNDYGNPGTEFTGRLSRYMNIIREETRRLGSHVEKVLQMAMLDRGEIKLKVTRVNIHDIIEKSLNNIGIQIEQREGEVDLDFEAENEVIDADEVHLTNIVYNLLDNAIKYSPETLHITIRTRSLPEGVCLTIADRGIGMTKEQVNRIFETFYRVPTGNLHDVKGFGLGLSYVQKMVDAHHGRIHVTSEPGQGSTFDVIIPYKMNE
ncbi:sensor histidine kinase [Arsenicibacter rosenii]|uniref:histidine kinase n=1 Tax=Arsenicibacter rosenii TaxID=1750698 RepID=A0A1S2VNW8_9BACT|nr:HAMP domain-containing sensor histidine kinase [Arsenicibacter rosenii]OIN60459.1 two-component sensor histidine kinase [Arsenicibacter rosenii]